MFETERKTILETPQSLALICCLAPTQHEALHDACVSALSALALTHIYDLTKTDSLSSYLPAFVESGPKDNKGKEENKEEKKEEKKKEEKEEEEEEKKGVFIRKFITIIK